MTGRTFASDNNSGVHPSVLAAIAEANQGHAHAYGDDPWTAQGARAVRAHVGEHADVFFTFNGTGANVTGLSSLLRAGDAIVCAASAHIAVDECGAPERFSGCKVLTVPTDDGKLRPSGIEPLLSVQGIEHHAQPRVISISQVAETGVVYVPDEVRALSDLAHGHGMYLHMDGARISNAAVALGVPIRAVSTDAGVDVLSLGGTKNGLLFGEAVCFLAPGLADRYPFQRKSGAQLASKMRFVGAQFAALYGSSLWHELASHSNAMAARLAAGAGSAGVELAWPADANEVFAILPAAALSRLRETADFYEWEKRDGDLSVARWVCSWDTTEDDVDRFVAAVSAEAGGAA